MADRSRPSGRNRDRYRWFVVGVFFAFMLLHQSDKLLIGPLATPIMQSFKIGEVQMGAVFSLALLVDALLYPLWGYLYDRFARAKLLALASAIWGATTWLSALAPTFPTFLVTRASTGIDDSSYPGLFSLVSDYFGPELRGRVYGLLQISQPLGYMIGLLAATLLGGLLGWRGIYYLTGSLGLLLAAVIYFCVREPARGGAEPELQGVDHLESYKFEWAKARGLFSKRSLLLLFAQGFVGVFPWNVISAWFFRYLEVDRDYAQEAILLTMLPAILALSAGYFAGGSLGDLFFRRTPRGRLLVSMAAVLLGAVLLSFTLRVPLPQQGLFMGLLVLTAFFIPFSSPNVVATVYDITLPEVRSTAIAVQYFIESSGAALAPLLAGIIASQSSLGTAIQVICITAWLLGSLFLALAAYLVPADIATLRGQMRDRAEIERPSGLTADR